MITNVPFEMIMSHHGRSASLINDILWLLKFKAASPAEIKWIGSYYGNVALYDATTPKAVWADFCAIVDKPYCPVMRFSDSVVSGTDNTDITRKNNLHTASIAKDLVIVGQTDAVKWWIDFRPNYWTADNVEDTSVVVNHVDRVEFTPVYHLATDSADSEHADYNMYPGDTPAATPVTMTKVFSEYSLEFPNYSYEIMGACDTLEPIPRAYTTEAATSKLRKVLGLISLATVQDATLDFFTYLTVMPASTDFTRETALHTLPEPE